MEKPAPALSAPYTLKQQKAARYLASLGGTMPDLEDVPRRRVEIPPDPDGPQD